MPVLHIRMYGGRLEVDDLSDIAHPIQQITHYQALWEL